MNSKDYGEFPDRATMDSLRRLEFWCDRCGHAVAAAAWAKHAVWHPGEGEATADEAERYLRSLRGAA